MRGATPGAHEIDIDRVVLRESVLSERVASWFVLAIAVTTALGAVWAIRPPREPGEGLETQPSSKRLLGHVGALATAPRPPGTEAHRAARSYIVEQLNVVGFEVDEQQRTVAVERSEGMVVAARLTNIVARRRREPSRGIGQGGAGSVGLMAHYDSRANTRGAADNAAGVATVLETLRILPPRGGASRDLVAIFTDGEELGLLGARALAEGHPWLDDLEFLLNVEARGSSGPSILFETTPDNLELARAFAEFAPYPFATSVSDEAYRHMPVDTDFTELRSRPIAGFNFAFMGRFATYHTMLDTVDRLDPRSLWHQTANVAALAESLTGLDRSLESRRQGVFFTLPGWHMIVYPVWIAVSVAVVTLLLAVPGLWRTRQDIWTGPGLLRGAGLALVGPAAGLVVGGIVWELVALVPSGALAGPHHRPHEPLWFAGAASVLTIVVVSRTVRRLTRAVGMMEAFAGTLLVWAVVALTFAWFLPGVSYLAVWPAAAGWVAWWIQTRAGNDRRRGGVHLVASAAALVSVALFAPVLLLLLDALTLSGLAVIGALFGFLLTLLSPQLAAVGEMRRVSNALVALALVLLLAGWVRTTAAPDRPHVDSLLYVAEESGSWWYSLDAKVDVWTSRVMGADPERVQAPEGLLLSGRRLLRSPAPPVDLRGPSIALLETAGENETQRSLEITPRAGGEAVWLTLSSPALERVSIAGMWFDVEQSAAEIRVALVGGGDRPWRLGLEISETADEDAEIEAVVLEQRYGFPEGVGVENRPSDLVARSSFLTDSTFVSTRAQLPLTS